jgi:hypothetical protein
MRFSTSTVREIVFGILEGHKKMRLTASEVANVDRVLDNVSLNRLPTELVGYSTGKESMQHPTSPGGGYFADATMTASEHARHDLARKARFIDAVVNEMKTNPKGTLEDFINAGLREAIAYTLNEMAAPITAADIKPHSLKKNVPDDQLKDAVEKRERLKKNLVALGGVQEPADPLVEANALLTRDWILRRGKGLRSASARRL